MPQNARHQLPNSVRDNLPRHLREMYEGVPSTAMKQYQLESEAKESSSLVDVIQHSALAGPEVSEKENELHVWLSIKKKLL